MTPSKTTSRMTTLTATRLALGLALCALLALSVAYHFEREAVSDARGENMRLHLTIALRGFDSITAERENADLHSRIKSLRIFSRTVWEQNKALKARIAELERGKK